MNSITSQDVEHIAHLARLTLSEEEKELFLSQLSNILAHITKLHDLDTTAVEPTTHAIPLQNVMRADISHPSLDKESVMVNAPQTQEGFFRVPRILEEE